jgi:RHH-type transcriptional regulator, proline utilization regulon repressor / proline dehydrogenase / delta 1-pyrroline-5-carboxylate dehydrogenase
VLKDPEGPAFALGFVDRVARPEDLSVAARNFRSLSQKISRFFAAGIENVSSRSGAFLPPCSQAIVVPIARWALKTLIGHLIIDASDKKLTAVLEAAHQKG